MEHINWCIQLNLAFDNAMMQSINEAGVREIGNLWEDGVHMLYCMGGEL